MSYTIMYGKQFLKTSRGIIPLALHGTVVKKDGSTVEIAVGEQPGDPVFGISDLLIHLSSEQLQKKAA